MSSLGKFLELANHREEQRVGELKINWRALEDPAVWGAAMTAANGLAVKEPRWRE